MTRQMASIGSRCQLKQGDDGAANVSGSVVQAVAKRTKSGRWATGEQLKQQRRRKC